MLNYGKGVKAEAGKTEVEIEEYRVDAEPGNDIRVDAEVNLVEVELKVEVLDQ